MIFVILLIAAAFAYVGYVEWLGVSSLARTPLTPNAKLLDAVRSRSCYSGLRLFHAVITVVAIVLCVLAWIAVLFSIPYSDQSLFYASSLYGTLIVGVLIERGLFTLIVDAVDLLIDSNRRAQERDGGGTAE
jgi:hypothetical protein